MYAWFSKDLSQGELEKFIKGKLVYNSYLLSFYTYDTLICTVDGYHYVLWEITTLLQTCILYWVGNLDMNPQAIPFMTIGMNR